MVMVPLLEAWHVRKHGFLFSWSNCFSTFLLLVQVCGLKLVESQLLASLAAAHARSDAATLRSQRLAAALEAAAAAAKQQAPAYPTQYPSYTASAAVGPGAGGCGVGELSAKIAQLQAQALVQAQEVFELRDQLMQAKQVGYWAIGEICSSDACVACCQQLCSR
jgi:hypothetical protein